MKICLNIFIAVILLSFSASGKNIGIKSDSAFKYRDTTISLGNGFTIYASKGEFYENKEKPQYNFTTYMSVQLKMGTKTIFSDTTNEYQFDSSLPPISRDLENNRYEFLLGVNNRPNANYFLHLIIKNALVLQRDSLPEGFTNPKIMGSDGMLEFAGIWDYYEEWGDENDPVMGYTPIIFFEYRKDGIVLDSAMTIKVNTEIYGKFEGYKYKDTPYKVKIYQPKFNKEIKEIEKK